MGSNLICITEQAKLYITERKTSQHKPVRVTLQASSQTQLPTLVVGAIGHFWLDKTFWLFIIIEYKFFKDIIDILVHHCIYNYFRIYWKIWSIYHFNHSTKNWDYIRLLIRYWTQIITINLKKNDKECIFVLTYGSRGGNAE